MDALFLLGLLVALAIAAPRWGYDSRDGFDSLEHTRRHAWWPGGTGPSLTRLVPAHAFSPASPLTRDFATPAARCAGALVATLDGDQALGERLVRMTAILA